MSKREVMLEHGQSPFDLPEIKRFGNGGNAIMFLLLALVCGGLMAGLYAIKEYKPPTASAADGTITVTGTASPELTIPADETGSPTPSQSATMAATANSATPTPTNTPTATPGASSTPQVVIKEVTRQVVNTVKETQIVYVPVTSIATKIVEIPRDVTVIVIITATPSTTPTPSDTPTPTPTASPTPTDAPTPTSTEE